MDPKSVVARTTVLEIVFLMGCFQQMGGYFALIGEFGVALGVVVDIVGQVVEVVVELLHSSLSAVMELSGQHAEREFRQTNFFLAAEHKLSSCLQQAGCFLWTVSVPAGIQANPFQALKDLGSVNHVESSKGAEIHR